MASVEHPTTTTQGSPPSPLSPTSPSSSPLPSPPPYNFTYHTPHPSPGVEQISSFPRVHVGFDKPATTTDPFAAQREGGGVNPFENSANANTATEAGVEITSAKGGNAADEWDASKTPPSRFQQRKGSVFATPGSRDGHVARNTDRDAKYHEKLAEKGWGKKDRRGSKSSN